MIAVKRKSQRKSELHAAWFSGTNWNLGSGKNFGEKNVRRKNSAELAAGIAATCRRDCIFVQAAGGVFFCRRAARKMSGAVPHAGPRPTHHAGDPMARRCWKHSRQYTGRPWVGLKGTVVSFPHCEQVVRVSARW
jgi:hypothetical protein